MVFVTTDPARDTPSVDSDLAGSFQSHLHRAHGHHLPDPQRRNSDRHATIFRREIALPGIELRDCARWVHPRLHTDRAHLEFPAEITVPEESHDLVLLVREGWQLS